MEVVNYAYGNGTNELAEYTVNGNLKVKSNYDQNGNLLSESYERLGKEVKKTEYSWNAEGELNQVSHEYVKDPSLPQLPDQSLKFKYDENGNRIKKEVDGKTRYYINEGNTVLNELDENGDVVRTMVRGLEPVAEIEGDGTIRYLHQDALGSTVMETGSNGEVVREYDYDVYGGMLGLAGGTGSGLDQYNAEGTRYLYTDQEFDSESNLYYYNARYYNPSTGRFLSRDPILGQPGNVLSNNPYIYVQNNPLKFTDPSGMATEHGDAATKILNHYGLGYYGPMPSATSNYLNTLAYQAIQSAYDYVPESPKASISNSTSKNVGNPSGSKSSFKQIASKAYEDTKKLISTVLQYAAQESIQSVNTQANIAEKVYYERTAWHFEERDQYNGVHPTYDEVVNDPKWRLLSPEQSIFHDNGVLYPELKYINEDGREAVFSMDQSETYEPYTDPDYMATYNYINPAQEPNSWYDISGWSEFTIKGAGHILKDVLPYSLGGNVRGEG